MNLCSFGAHKYGRYEEIDKQHKKIWEDETDKYPARAEVVIIARRICTRCGHTKYNRKVIPL